MNDNVLVYDNNGNFLGDLEDISDGIAKTENHDLPLADVALWEQDAYSVWHDDGKGNVLELSAGERGFYLYLHRAELFWPDGVETDHQCCEIGPYIYENDPRPWPNQAAEFILNPETLEAYFGGK